MKRILSRLALLGIVAAGALGASVATSWSCGPGSTDCPVDSGPRDWRAGRPDMRVERPGRPGIGAEGGEWRRDRPDWRPDDGRGRPHWRPDRDNRPRFDRHRPPRDYPDRWRNDRWRGDGWRGGSWRDRPSGGIFLNFDVDRYVPGYYDDGYYDPRPRYVQPRYRVRLSAAHVEWCYARYRTYRVSDNTFKPTRHSRRVCISPFS